MLRGIREWLELRACVLALITIRFSAIYWFIVLAARFFTREPLLYSYSLRDYTQETVPVGALLLVQVVAILYQLLKRLILGTAADSWVLHNSSPKIAGCSGIVFLLWWQSGPARGAHCAPLMALVGVSILGTILVRRGPLARDAERTSVASGAHVHAEDDSTTRVTRPRAGFSAIHGHDQLKERLLRAASDVLSKEQRGRQNLPRNGILLHGSPGNGKTAFAQALAGELQLPLLTLTHADVASKWIGERTSRVRAAFDEAARHQPCVLLVDELDSFLESRDATGPGTVKEDRDLVNALLTLMVDIRSARVLLVAATNHLDRLDAAAVREGRFDFKIEIPSPDLQARTGLLRDALRSQLPRSQVSADVIDAVARRWNGYSSKRILAVVEELLSVLRSSGRHNPEFRDFMAALRAVQGHAVPQLGSIKPLRELVLSERTSRALENVLTRMADPERTESQGGTLPSGIVMFGPPGTGKTAAAKALAHELGWTFLAVTGAELARDLDALAKLYAKAQEQRPALVFIDEADELLRHRDYSSATGATNKLLTLMDGAGERVRDVVWIAATNHMEHLDPALLRGGRFSEKIAFDLPTYDALFAHIERWLRGKNVGLEPSFEVAGLVDLLGSYSIADAEAVVQTALNLAIGRGGSAIALTRSEVVQAIELADPAASD